MGKISNSPETTEKRMQNIERTKIEMGRLKKREKRIERKAIGIKISGI